MSGTRLPGDSEANDRHKSDLRAETRLSGDLAARFEQFMESHDAQKSEVLREALDEFLPSSANSEYVLPRNPELKDAYLALAGEDEKRVMPVSKAESILSQQTHPNEPLELIREDVIAELDGSGLLAVKGGRVAVAPLTPRDEVTPQDGDRNE
ncbi:hypothetical protein SAMN05216388_1001244 [Halorientalis persicus]|uniref:Uncharacterized protein n=1 Tax=Halorientalis persicus TaxID=1367881 RepID=A0A1H8DED9_9EURY|nr:hypothetical protein [Halorientalis persicus]SEN04898.1 hypothetical protein SAMN05216388_1001244 [Halorientalis persicus]